MLRLAILVADATDLVEANVGGLLTEALTADVQAVLADETGLVGADTAVQKTNVSSCFLCCQSASCIPPNAQFPPCSVQRRVFVPFAAALAVGARARVPD